MAEAIGLDPLWQSSTDRQRDPNVTIVPPEKFIRSLPVNGYFDVLFGASQTNTSEKIDAVAKGSSRQEQIRGRGRLTMSADSAKQQCAGMKDRRRQQSSQLIVGQAVPNDGVGCMSTVEIINAVYKAESMPQSARPAQRPS